MTLRSTTLAEIAANPAAAIVAAAQRPPAPHVKRNGHDRPLTQAEHLAGCLAYAEAQPERIDREITRLTTERAQWVEAVDTLRRLTTRLAKEHR